MHTTAAVPLTSFLAECYSALPPRPSGSNVQVRLDNPANQNGKSQFFSVTLTLPAHPSGTIRLTLVNLPTDADVESAAGSLYGEWSETVRGRTLTVTLTDKSHPKLRKLAQAIKRVVGRGKRYTDSNWKWTAPAIADTLVELTDHVRDYRRQLQ